MASSVTDKMKLQHAVQPEGGEGVVLPDAAAAPSDESPTIISRASPSHLKRRDDDIRGRSLAHFELLEPIGVGGMAAVIRARDKQLERFVALKILPPEMAADKENVLRFHHEARAAARLDHENIARVFYYAEDQGLHFIAFEFVEGKNVRTLLEERGGPLPVAEAIHYILQIACGLEHAASRGVVHRDIKPSNIIITPTGRAKLVDMGLARSIGKQEEGALTQSGVTLGTFDYISPEQALEPREADTRSDIYSLGCTFYHMATGHPPVPEGTAAKKLHHHQHVAPLDPRELNPQVPDEVAAILVRMMAKEPRRRYQTPRHLVQHLLQAAQMLGAAPDLPDEVLFVDTPLPSPPQKHPVLVASLALVLLGAFLFAYSLWRPTPPPAGAGPDRVARNRPDENKTIPVIDQPPRIISNVRAVADVNELRAALKEENVTRIVLKGNLPGAITTPLLAAINADRHLTIEPDATQGPVKITVNLPTVFEPQQIDDGVWAGLMLACKKKGSVTLRNIHFVVESLPGTPKAIVAGVAVRDGGRFKFENCTFTQKDAPLSILNDDALFPISSVVVEGAMRVQDEQPQVAFDKCFFHEGQVAVALLGAAEISPTDCAFGPHAALFNMQSETLEPAAVLHLERCSALVTRGPAFRLDDAARCHLRSRHCIFSSLGAESALAGARAPNQHPSLIFQVDTVAPAVRYLGERNCYHNLNVYWGRPRAKEDGIITKDLFEAFVRNNGGDDIDSTELAETSNPFISPTPHKDLDRVLAGTMADAFKANPELAQLRVQPDPSKNLKQHTTPLGITWAGPLELAELAPKEPELARKPHQILVHPDVKESTGIYSTLERAIANAKDGDEILIVQSKKSRVLEVQPATIRSGLNLVVKPYGPEHRPILALTPRPSILDKAVRLFTIHGDSKLDLDSVEILLDPNIELLAAGMVGIVELVGSGQCSFRKCLLTLRGNNGPRLCVATLRDPDGEMPIGANPRSVPGVYLFDSFIRGEGDVLNVPASRPLEFSLSNTLAAISGAALRVQGSNKDVSADLAASVRLDRTTIIAGESVIHLQGNSDGKGLAPTRVDTVQDCLLSCPGPVAKLMNVNVNEDSLMECFRWTGGANAYCGFDETTYLQHERSDFFVGMSAFNKEAWKRFSGESGSLFVGNPFQGGMMERPLSQATLSDFRVTGAMQDMLLNFGARIEAGELPPLNGAAAGTTPEPLGTLEAIELQID